MTLRGSGSSGRVRGCRTRLLLTRLALFAALFGSLPVSFAGEHAERGPSLSDLIAQLQEGEVAERRVAARELGRLGPKAEPAVPALIQALKLNQFASAESEALGHIGPPAIPALLEAIEGKQNGVQGHCVRALGLMGPKARSTTPVLLGLFKHPSGRVRYEAAIALGRIEPGGRETVQAISRLLGDSENFVRAVAARTLASMGLAARDAVPALIKAFALNSVSGSDTSPPAEVSALVRIGPTAIPALTEGLRNENARIRAQCAWALELLGPRAKSATPKLIGLLNDDSSAVRGRAVRALGAIAPAEPEVMRALVQVWRRQPSSDEMYHTARVLGKVGRPAVPVLVEALAGGENSQRFAAQALARIGSEASPAVPALIRILRAESSRVYSSARSSAVEALAAIGQAAVPEVVRLVGDSSDTVRRRGVAVLEKLGPRAAGAAPALTSLLGRQDPAVRAAAAEALAHIGLDAKAAVPRLVELLADKNDKVRLAAAQAVESIGPDARTAAPALKKLLNDPSPWVRRWAVRGLGSVHREPGDTVPLFVAALADKESGVQTAALDMLARLDADARAAAPEVAGFLGGAKEKDVREAAIRALHCTGSDDQMVLEALARSVPDSKGAVEALVAKGLKAKAVLPTLIPLMKDRKSITQVTRVLQVLGREAEPATAALLEALLIEVDRPMAGSVDMRHTTAGRVLSRIGAPAVPGLVRLLKYRSTRGARTLERSPQELVRARALEVLAAMAPGEAAAAVPALIPLVAHPETLTACRAVRTLGNIGSKAGGAVPALRKATRRVDKHRRWQHEYPNRSVAIEAHRALAAITERPEPHVEALLDMVRERRKVTGDPSEFADVRWDERKRVGEALGAIGAPALPAVLEALNDKRWGVRYGCAYKAIERMGRFDAIPFPTVMRWLDGESNLSLAFLVIRGLGPRARAAVPKLVEMLRDERYRGLVVDVLAAVGPDARDAVPELTRLLRGPAIPGEREQCLEALTAIGQDAKAAVPEIIRIVGDESLFPSSLQWAAYRAIEAIGPAAEEAVPTILAALRKNPSLGWAAASAFRAMGAAAAEAVDDLVMVLRRADRTYADRPGPRQLACEALGRIGLPAARAVPALVVATHDRESAVRHAAREALQRIRRE